MGEFVNLGGLEWSNAVLTLENAKTPAKKGLTRRGLLILGMLVRLGNPGPARCLDPSSLGFGFLGFLAAWYAALKAGRSL